MEIHAPKISSAIPRRRYRVGQFTMVVLGDVDSPDAADYRYILAAVVEGDSEPGLYISSERASAAHRAQGSHIMRVIMRDGAQVIGASDRWTELSLFVEDALSTAVRILNLADEEVRRLM